MGILRFYLALSVLNAHMPQSLHFIFVGPEIAVEAFFVISGYVISQILHVRKNQTQYQFISARIRRIYPTYLLVLTLTIAANLLNGTELKLNPITILINTFIIGLDVFIFVNYYNGVPLGAGIFLPQSWSLALEMYFYFFAKSITKFRTRTILVYCFLALFLKIVLSLSEVLFDPFSYRLAPFEAAYFMLGILSYRIRARLELSRLALLTSSTTLAAFFFLSPALESITAGLFLLLWLPKLWQFDSEFSLSRILGALSYPFYLIHLLVLQIFLWFLSEYTMRIEQTIMFISVLSMSIAASLMLQVALKIIGKIRIKFCAQWSSHVIGRNK